MNSDNSVNHYFVFFYFVFQEANITNETVL